MRDDMRDDISDDRESVDRKKKHAKKPRRAPEYIDEDRNIVDYRTMIERYAKAFRKKFPEFAYDPTKDFKESTKMRAWFSYLYLEGTKDGQYGPFIKDDFSRAKHEKR